MPSVAWKIKAGQVDNRHLISNGLDLLPTICDYAGAQVPDGLVGRSLRPLLEGAVSEEWRDELYIENIAGSMVHMGDKVYGDYGEGETQRNILI